MPVAGDRIGDRYVLQAELGAGGMGVVFRARDERLERDVALKLLPPGNMGDAAARARLLREARAAAQLQHTCIVHVYDVGELSDGGAFLVMELVDGRCMRDLVGADIPLSTRLTWIVDVARALAHAHAAGIVHRDIKPDNVFIRKDGRVVLLDFGLAKPLPTALAQTVEVGRASGRITAEGNVVGTPAYLAPEQVKGEAVGPAADQFALATTAFELLTGRLPWQGGTTIEVVASMLRDAPERASTHVAGVPQEIDAALERAFKKRPADRFASVTDFADAIEKARAAAFGPAQSSPHLISATSGARPISGAELAETAEAPRSDALHATTGSLTTSSTSRAASGATTTPIKKNRLRLGVALGAVAVIAIGFGLVRTRGQDGAAGTRAASSSSSANAPALTIPADALVACPILVAGGDGVTGSPGWLGAAAASLTCDRIGVRLGTVPQRTLAPPDLLPDLPREPSEKAPTDPYCAADAMALTHGEAEKRAEYVVDGTVTRTPHEFVVELVLKRKGEEVVARGRGHDLELYAAISHAVREMLPNGPASPFQREWLGVTSTNAALDVMDIATADISEDRVDLAERCARFDADRDVLPAAKYITRDFCSRLLRGVALEEESPSIDPSTPALLATTVAARGKRGGTEEVHQRAEMLLHAEGSAESPEGKALLAGIAAELLFRAGDTDASRNAARGALQEWPRLVDVRATPYHRIAFAGEFDLGIAQSQAIWLPYDPVALENVGNKEETSLLTRLRLSGRAYLLGPRGFFADQYGELLARTGDVERARGIAERINHDLLRVQVLVAEGKYKQAVELAASHVAKLEANDETSRNAFRLAAAGAEAYAYTGGRRDFIDDMVKRYVDPEPAHVSAGVISYLDLVYACLEAPSETGKRCIKRLRELYARGIPSGVVGSAPAVLEGADRYVNGDVRGAAKSWRPLMAHATMWLISDIRNPMADAFDASGMEDLANKIDANHTALVGEPGVMDLSFVRAARRADKAGDHAEAARFAEAALAKWRIADEDVPMAKEMEAIRAKAHKKP